MWTNWLLDFQLTEIENWVISYFYIGYITGFTLSLWFNQVLGDSFCNFGQIKDNNNGHHNQTQSTFAYRTVYVE